MRSAITGIAAVHICSTLPNFLALRAPLAQHPAVEHHARHQDPIQQGYIDVPTAWLGRRSRRRSHRRRATCRSAAVVLSRRRIRESLLTGAIMKSQNYIDGQWVGASDGQTFAQRNPADLEHVPESGPKAPPPTPSRPLKQRTRRFQRGPTWGCTSAQSTCPVQSPC